jgi:hypothetical protein
VAGQLGYCGLDRRRQPLTGEEIRGCWDARPSVLDGTSVPLSIAAADLPEGAPRPLDFVEVGTTPPNEGGDAAVVETPLPSPTSLPAEPGWSLWGDADI